MESASAMDPKKQCFILNVISFLQDELINGNLNDERKESVEVAIQCLETAFELDAETKTKIGCEKVDLLSFIKITPKVEEISEERKDKAELCKIKGNSLMRNTKYNEALAEYTKAIQLNPNNAVYYCNRAAAYSRLEQNLEVIKDCKEAIRLDATYGKAYGRLGIAYSNLNQYEDARQAYMLALKFDPDNATYETNLRLAEETIFANMESAAPPEHTPLDISQFINNPNIITMATQMLTDPGFCTTLMQLISMSQSGDPRYNALYQIGENLARNMESSDPNLAERFRNSFDPEDQAAGTSEAPPEAPSEEANDDSTPSQSNEADKKTE